MSGFDHVTFVFVRSGGGNRYVASYFAQLKKMGFKFVEGSALPHSVNQINYASTYVFEHTGAGISRAEYDEAINALIEHHVELNHNAPYSSKPPHVRCEENVWYSNQRVDYTNEIRCWPNV